MKSILMRSKHEIFLSLAHQWHIFKPLEIWPRRLDEFQGENHYHEHQDDAEEAQDGHEASIR